MQEKLLYTIENLIKQAGSRTILDIPALNIESNRIYGLLGSNGAGKTTLLNILAFLEAPSSGLIAFNDKPVNFNRPGLHRLRQNVVMVEQHPVLFSTSVYKNIEFGLKIRNIESKQRERIIVEVLEMVALLPFKEEPVQGLSGGETQRIALARALALAPSVLLCDEPCSSVDMENQSVISTLLKEINNSSGISIIFTSHDRLQVAGLAHHTLLLEGGTLVSASYENIFSGVVLGREEDGNRIIYRLGDSVDLLLSGNMEPAESLNGDKRRVYIDPTRVVLLDKESDKKPDKNAEAILQGIVIQLTATDERVRMVVDVGVMLTVLLQRVQYQLHTPAIGDKVWLRIDGIEIR